jgi:hypothetical protein
VAKELRLATMKTFRIAFVLLAAAGLRVSAQEATAPPVPIMVPDAPATSSLRTAGELEQLLGPIALYPDALIALILPASTAPTDIVLAARHLRENPGDRAQIEHRAWDESVKSLTNYPEVVQWMDENLHWTRQIGEAFAVQPADVMQAIQRLRAKARAAGTLVDTPQQQVIAEPQVIRIVPAQPDVIYVPHYEPDVVFVDRPYYPYYYSRPYYYGSPFLTFGVGVPVGSWLAFDCDWRRNSIWVGNRHRRWTGHDWRRPVVSFAPDHIHPRGTEIRQWRPAPQVARPPVIASNRFRSEIARPAPFGLASSNLHTSSFTRRSDLSERPVAPPISQNRTWGYRQENSGQRPPATAIVPPLPASRSAVPTPAPNLQPLPQARRSGTDGVRDYQRSGNNTVRDFSNRPVSDGVRDYNNRSGGDASRDYSRSGNDGVRDYGNRSRSFRQQSQSSNTTAPLPVAPAMPSISPGGGADRMGPAPHRSYSRSSSSAGMTAPQIQARSAPPPAVVNPVNPPAAPQTAPAAAPQSAPAQRGSGGESRGHRGANNQRL